MVIIGSQALNFYTPLSRKMHDWDFIATEEEFSEFSTKYGKYWVKTTDYSVIFDIDGTVVEIRNPKELDVTDRYLLRDSFGFAHRETPFGRVALPSIQILYDIKKSTALCIDEPKHKADQRLIEDLFDVKSDSLFFLDRLEETIYRTKNSKKIKYDFFHKYHIPEYILHDRLHEMIADMLEINMPTYQRITSADVDVSEQLFNNLSHDQKVSLMAEECLVLNLERWFIPQMVENGINHKLVDYFYDNNEAMPTYQIFKHVNITGLKGEATYVVDFGRKNFFEIEKKWIAYKEVIKQKGGFPGWFYDELFELRDKQRITQNNP